jgi:hypothetical protein
MVMMTYTQHVRETILKRSVGGTLPEAFDEWSFTNQTIDHEAPVQVCQLCGKKELRYHYGIANRYTHHHLWVGSHCILQFDVAVIENGQRLSSENAKKHLNKLRQKMQLESCIKALTKLSVSENNTILTGALEYYQRKKKLTPKFAFVVFWKLQDHSIEHQPSFFQVELKRQKHIDDLQRMETGRVHRFWHALSSAQRQKAIELGHVPPPPAQPAVTAVMPTLPPLPPRSYPLVRPSSAATPTASGIAPTNPHFPFLGK